MVQRSAIGCFWMAAVLTVAGGLAGPDVRAQGVRTAVPAGAPAGSIEQPDANRTKEGLSRLLEGYPPTVRSALALDHSLLTNQPFLAPYPALVNYLNAHPEITRNPSFYVGENHGHRGPRTSEELSREMWSEVLAGLAIFAGFGMAFALVVWLVRTIVDYRRWSRLAKVQTDAHTKLLDRFTANEDLIHYMQSPAGAKFLESSPIRLDAGPRGVGAPLGRILLSIQGGVVLVAVGIGLQFVSRQAGDEGARVLHALGILGVAAGIGFVLSAIISYAISHRLGLITRGSATRIDAAGTPVPGDLE